MKRYLYLFLLAALACGCNDNEDSGAPTGSGSETQQPLSPSEILPRRLVSVDVTVDDYSPYTQKYSYDAQGRLVSIWEDDSHEGTYVYADNTIVASEMAYRLENGWAVFARWDNPNVWYEITFGYDARGYLASLSVTDEGDKSDCTISYAMDGVSFRFRSREDEWDSTLSIEFDRARLNNLNLDFYGEFCAGLEDLIGEALLLGVGGQRLRYLPAKVTVVTRYEEEGQWYTDKSVYRYVYHMDGDYLSEVEMYVDFGEGELEEPVRIVFHYE